MKKLIIIIMLLPFAAVTQEKITGIEWWLGNDHSNAVFKSVDPTSEIDDSLPIDLSGLAPCKYTISFRFRSSSGKWSPVVIRNFTMTPNQSDQVLITAMQYWIDDDFENLTHLELENPVNTLDDLLPLDLSEVSVGRHWVYLRFKDSNGRWSGIQSQRIVKTPLGDDKVYIAAMEYWFNQDVEMSRWLFFNDNPTEIDTEVPIDLSSLNEGTHLVSLRFYNNLGQYSAIQRSLVKRLPVGFSENLISAYRYWFNNELLTLVREEFPAALASQDATVTILMSQFGAGEKVLVSIQFLDILGQWSAIHADSVTIFDPTPVNEAIFSSEKLLVYPNPARDRVTIEWSDAITHGKVKIYITDATGNILLTDETETDNGKLYSMDLVSLSSGVYHIVIQSESGRFSKRLIKL